MGVKTFSVLNTIGVYFEGEIPGTICFVPTKLLVNNVLNEGMYLNEGWATLNIKAQWPQRGIGSHLFPDISKPFYDEARCRDHGNRIIALRSQTVAA